MASMAMAVMALRQPQIHTVPVSRKCPGLRRGALTAAPLQRRGRGMVVAFSTPLPGGKVEESIKQAEELCAEDPASAECAVAWDEVEEMSAEASHQRVKDKATDPLETFCKENPETDECRVYDN